MSDSAPAAAGPRRAAILAVSLKLYLGHVATLEWCRSVGDIASRAPAVTGGRLDLVVLPAVTALSAVAEILDPAVVAIGGQDLWTEDSGPFTGEISGADLAAIGCRFAEVGHAERRRIFAESDDLVHRKLVAATRNGLTPILCVGEERRSTERDAVGECIRQLGAALAGQGGGAPAPHDLVVAYEPVWAIGAAEAAPPDHVAPVCAAIKRWAADWAAGTRVRVIYGGAAREGIVSSLGDSVDGLFLGRFGHDTARLARVIDELSA
ncbi:MAG TPA: triose-phosphate isomerase family protein [Acidimicrobiales bacterium]|nr:triose-phosphate isomerase family protein [Acidimicrobiales bacterium]